MFLKLHNIKYVIKHIPKQPLNFGPTYNSNFNENLVLSIKDEDLLMVEDGSYQQFPRGQLAFTKLMKSFRKEYKPDKQVYRLNGFPYALNSWNDCSNVQPTQEEIRSLDLQNNNHVPLTQPATPDVNHEEVKPDEVPGFEEFSSKPLEQLLRKSTRVSTTGSTLLPKRRKVAHLTKNNVPKATQPDEQPNHPFQTLNSHPPQVDNVSGVPYNTVFRRIISDNAGLEELKGHMKSYHIDVIFYYLRKKSKLRSMDQYRYTTCNCLFKSYINNAYKRYYCSPTDDTLSTQEHIARADVVSVYERSINDVIYEFSIPANLPWHLVDEVYISINCDEEFHRVLAVVVLRESDCGKYVTAFAECLSDEMKVPSIPFRSDYLRSRYATLLWKYGTDKAKAGYVSENDDPTRLKGVFIPLIDDELINVVY
ncbi:hypothetical protein H5410_014233 [Solanum commersonii]|uniref:Ulp1 protease family, C-terminal catalytic domain containing protein n=1 Tax=Solanum commersonii TaxID=4109 RepID=A0A9J5ZQC8_SOLCO|nr:hypothetical protein H5410_014233 [Solanum commersonii]